MDTAAQLKDGPVELQRTTQAFHMFAAKCIEAERDTQGHIFGNLL